MTVFQRLKDLVQVNKSFIDESFIHRDEYSIQRQFAPILRKAVMQHLATGDSVVARGFRGEYAAANGKLYEQFIEKQGKNGAWATDIEATVIGKLFECNIKVTQVTKGKEVATYFLYEEHKGAPTIHLYNSNNTHWYTAEGHTIADGNCLYNAIAQSVQRLSRAELIFKPAAQPSVTQYVARKGFFGNAKSTPNRTIALIENQKAIEKAISSHAKSSELEAQQRAEQERISKLSPQERDQIAKDYELALKIAAEEITTAGKSPASR